MLDLAYHWFFQQRQRSVFGDDVYKQSEYVWPSLTSETNSELFGRPAVCRIAVGI